VIARGQYPRKGMRQLTLCTEVYDALVAHVGSALDYDSRWQPNEEEPDGFVERLHPLDLRGGTHASANRVHCGAQVPPNRAAG
jgi:hypothetical protein